MDIALLERQVLDGATADAPGREFCEAIAELARTGRLDDAQPLLPSEVYAELAAHYQGDPAGFVANWRGMAHDMRHGFVEHARQRLTSLTRLQPPPSARPAPDWQQLQRALDTQENELLRTALALELLALIEPAAMRATELRECVVTSPCSEEADRYLDEATRCYFFGLYTASAVMCRSVLEEAIRRRLPPALGRLLRTRYRNTPTLGNLLHEVNNNLRLCAFNPAFLPLANRVNDVGKRAVHQGLLSEDEARACLQDARRALQLLLG